MATEFESDAIKLQQRNICFQDRAKTFSTYSSSLTTRLIKSYKLTLFVFGVYSRNYVNIEYLIIMYFIIEKNLFKIVKLNRNIKF